MLLDAGWSIDSYENPYVYLTLDIFNLHANFMYAYSSSYRNIDSNLLSQILIMPNTDTRQAFCEELMREHQQAVSNAITTGNPKSITYAPGYMEREEK